MPAPAHPPRAPTDGPKITRPKEAFCSRKVGPSNRGPKSGLPAKDIRISPAAPEPAHFLGIPWRPTFWVPGRGCLSKLRAATRSALRALVTAASGRKLRWQPPGTLPGHAPQPRPGHHLPTLLIKCVMDPQARRLTDPARPWRPARTSPVPVHNMCEFPHPSVGRVEGPAYST